MIRWYSPGLEGVSWGPRLRPVLGVYFLALSSFKETAATTVTATSASTTKGFARTSSMSGPAGCVGVLGFSFDVSTRTLGEEVYYSIPRYITS